ncbi:hypothetical protein D0T84_10410 [Dysgonomonas sp. 521]|uniref:hypothetical protein n=1 Tax=Dysgonomonas sp. 521 TaxID=2302932 RepID=UPI0013D5E8F8|nr:hypothetical protein [Dysgonomonas sp. 521]NDV95330.1 hypothetical protein [Dysgonomonas sp. 521]
MKRNLLLVLFSTVLALGVMAQQEQTSGNLIIKVESTRVIGDQLLVSGKMFANKEFRIMNLKTSIVAADGDAHKLSGLWWGGKSTYLSSFDQTLQPDIPYSFDFAFATQNKDMNPVTAMLIDARDWTNKIDMKFNFKAINVPLNEDPNLTPGTMEIGKNIYLTWKKYEESATGLTINFVIENKSNKDQEMSFRSYSNARIIDKEGNIYEGTLTLRDRVEFPSGTPKAASVSIKEKIKMSEVKMVQFESGDFKYSVKDKDIIFPAK